MPPGHHNTSPTGLGKGSTLVLMMASGFSASSFPQDNTEAADTYASLELHCTCAAMPVLLGSSWGCWSLAVAWGEEQAAHLDLGAALPAQGQGWAALTPVLVFILPAPAALNPLSQEPQIFGFASAFGSWPERTGSQHNKPSGEVVYHYHWGSYTLSDKSLQELMWCHIFLEGTSMGVLMYILPPSPPNSSFIYLFL